MSAKYQTSGPSAESSRWTLRCISDSRQRSILCYPDKEWLDDDVGGQLNSEIALMVVLIAVKVDLASRSIPFYGTL